MKKEILEQIGTLWFEDMWNIPDFNIVDKIVDSNFKPEWIQIDSIGPALVKREISHFRSIFPDLNQRVTDIAATNNRVWIRYTAKATHRGNAWGFKATNKQVKFEAAAILYVNNQEKVFDMWEAYCFYDLLEQLGLVPSFYDLHKYFSDSLK